MTTYLVSGANRGIGKAFIAAYLQRPNSTVVAAVRTPASAEPLNDFPKAEGSKLIIVKLDSSSETDPKDAVAELQKQGVDRIDFVIANAGIAGEKTTATIDIIPSVARDVFNINSIGPLLLLNATAPLLKKSNKPTFAVISSAAGSIGIQAMFAKFPVKMSPYGASKAAVNWLVERIHLEEKWLVATSLHPGLVTTDMSAGALPDGMDPKEFGITPLTPDESVKQMNEVLDRATREKEGGKLVQHDGEILPW